MLVHKRAEFIGGNVSCVIFQRTFDRANDGSFGLRDCIDHRRSGHRCRRGEGLGNFEVVFLRGYNRSCLADASMADEEAEDIRIEIRSARDNVDFLLQRRG